MNISKNNKEKDSQLNLNSSMAAIISHMLIFSNPCAYLLSFNRIPLKLCCASHTSSSSINGVTALPKQQTSSPPCDRNPAVTRRSGNYKPTIWDFDFIQTLNSEYIGERYLNRANELKAELKMMLEDARKSTINRLEFIDDLQRLGISYHFEDEIKQILRNVYEQRRLKNDRVLNQRNLYVEALEFRLLRQHGFKVSQDAFDQFKDEKGQFKSSHRNDIEGIIQLYEASHMLVEGENTLEQAREFAITLLRKNLENQSHPIDQNVTSMAYYALEQPSHWRIQRPNARWFITVYEERPDMNPMVLQFAKLDFNILQATHQQELKHVSRWWRRICLAEKLPFARDRVVECCFWAIGVLPEPQYGNFRVMCTKVIALITIIDDIYDVYGTLEELQLFTDVIQRWDTETMDQLPKYMQLCFLALNNFVHEMAYDVLKDQGFAIVPFLKKSWKDMCNAFMQEAEWYYGSYTPGVEEYINHGWISASVPVILTHSYFLVANPLKKDVLTSLYGYHDIIKWSGMILRFADDLGTSPEEMKRGDVPKLIQCYMNENGAGEKEAEEHVRFLIRETWKKMNGEIEADEEEGPMFPDSFITSAVNLGRMALYMYQHGDGHGSQNIDIKNRIQSLLFEPVL